MTFYKNWSLWSLLKVFELWSEQPNWHSYGHIGISLVTMLYLQGLVFFLSTVTVYFKPLQEHYLSVECWLLRGMLCSWCQHVACRCCFFKNTFHNCKYLIKHVDTLAQICLTLWHRSCDTFLLWDLCSCHLTAQGHIYQCIICHHFLKAPYREINDLDKCLVWCRMGLTIYA